ncbi:hypothetical protein SAMN04324257_02023 [Thermoanaerobacter thermohydrosulfuricus]|nr:hypothetical protein SAMN04324257_02023 [Thermoanaerobacter thermohydrosulfuricus]
MHKERLVTKRPGTQVSTLVFFLFLLYKLSYLSAGKLSKTEGGGRAEAMDGGGGHLKAWMPPDVGTLPEPEGRALVLSLWNIGATMQNISFEYFLTLSTN